MKESHWMELCQQASDEEDPEKLMELITEISRLLDEKRDTAATGARGAGRYQEIMKEIG